MKWKLYIFSGLACNALPIGCTNDKSGGNMQETATSMMSATSTLSTTSGNGSGSVTSELGSDTAPTMATTMMTEPSTNGSTGEPCSFLECEDMFPSHECDHFAQDCPEGQKCSAYASDRSGTWDATKCVDVTGMDKPGYACVSEGITSGIDSCIEGAMCWDVDLNGVGTCVALCSGSDDAPLCDYPGYCGIAAGGFINLCYGYCNPLLQDCPKADVCYLNTNGFFCALDSSGDAGQTGDPCTSAEECKATLMCADAAFVGAGCAGSTNCCTPFCDFPDGACPNPDQQCVQYLDKMQLPPGNPYLDIGICGIAG